MIITVVNSSRKDEHSDRPLGNCRDGGFQKTEVVTLFYLTSYIL